MLRGLGALFLGGLLGAGLAMLATPRPGAEVRRGLRDQYGEAVSRGRLRATELVRSHRDEIDERLSQGQDLVNTAIEKARTTIDELAETPTTPTVPTAETRSGDTSGG